MLLQHSCFLHPPLSVCPATTAKCTFLLQARSPRRARNGTVQQTRTPAGPRRLGQRKRRAVNGEENQLSRVTKCLSHPPRQKAGDSGKDDPVAWSSSRETRGSVKEEACWVDFVVSVCTSCFTQILLIISLVHFNCQIHIPLASEESTKSAEWHGSADLNTGWAKTSWSTETGSRKWGRESTFKGDEVPLTPPRQKAGDSGKDDPVAWSSSRETRGSVKEEACWVDFVVSVFAPPTSPRFC